MSFVDLTTIVVTGTYRAFDGTPAWGNVTFDSPNGLGSLLDPAGTQIVVPRQLVAKLDDAGHISISLPATDDPDLTPQGWTFIVSENVVDADGVRPNRYQIEVPFDTPGGTFDLSAAPHVGASAGSGASITVLGLDDVLFWMGVYDGIGAYH